MNTSEQITILGAVFVSQLIAMALPYWIGRETNNAILRGKIDQLEKDLREAREHALSLYARLNTGTPEDREVNHA